MVPEKSLSKPTSPSDSFLRRKGSTREEARTPVDSKEGRPHSLPAPWPQFSPPSAGGGVRLLDPPRLLPPLAQAAAGRSGETGSGGGRGGGGQFPHRRSTAGSFCLRPCHAGVCMGRSPRGLCFPQASSFLASHGGCLFPERPGGRRAGEWPPSAEGTGGTLWHPQA